MSYFLHNHLRFNILYNRDATTDLARHVGFEVQPFSVRHEYEKPWDKANPVLTTCNPGRMVAVSHSQAPLEVKEGSEVIFSYDVKFTVRAGEAGGMRGVNYRKDSASTPSHPGQHSKGCCMHLFSRKSPTPHPQTARRSRTFAGPAAGTHT